MKAAMPPSSKMPDTSASIGLSAPFGSVAIALPQSITP
jgi:hypothetical protein